MMRVAPDATVGQWRASSLDMRRTLAAAVAVTALLAGCAGTTPPPTVDLPQAPQDSDTRIGPHSLEPWKDFPVDANPRPQILIGELVNVGEGGFATGDAKLAFLEGSIDPDGKVPPEAEPAFKKLTQGKPLGSPAIRVLSVSKGTADYATDRGSTSLPVWRFRLTDTIGDIVVLAEPVTWHRTQLSFGPQKVSADGLTLTLSMPAPAPPCPGQPTTVLVAESLESDTAVAVGLRTEDGPIAPGEPKGECVHDLMMRYAEYTVKLNKPLGNRVLVDAQGNPMAVTIS